MFHRNGHIVYVPLVYIYTYIYNHIYYNVVAIGGSYSDGVEVAAGESKRVRERKRGRENLREREARSVTCFFEPSPCCARHDVILKSVSQ